VIIVDANVLLYAYNSRSPAHLRCREWLEAALNGAEQIGMPWQTLMAFVRIATNPRVFKHPLTAREACEMVNVWLARPQVIVVNPGERFWTVFAEQVVKAQVTGPLVTDASLASLAMEHGARLCTTDRDFTRFSGLRLVDPLH
jgi:uncharacterized protein